MKKFETSDECRIESGRTVTAGVRDLLILTVFWLFAGTSFAQAPAVPSANPPNISGFWELHFDGRNIPRASLTPHAAAMNPDIQARRDIHAIRWCNLLGVPFLMDSGAPIDIEQDQKVVGILAGPVSSPRTIYLDGRAHPNSDTYDSTTNGDSIGKWEGDTLVVDTIGFNDKGVTSIPGGGIRTPNSHLVERFRLLDGGKYLAVTSTWRDPKIFAKPHTYEYIYVRAAPGYRPRDYACNSSDKERADFSAESSSRIRSWFNSAARLKGYGI